MDRNKYILILSVSAGAGHVRAGAALLLAARKQYPSYNVVHLDVMTRLPKLFRKIYCDAYIALVKEHPKVWGYLYDKTEAPKPGSQFNRLRRQIERLNTVKLRKMLKENPPDVIICSHFLPAQIMSDMIKKKEINVPVWVAVTDFDVHSMWIHSNMAGYIASNEEVAFRMELKGIKKEMIRVLGIPVMPVFEKRLSRTACARELGVAGDKTTFLLMAGGAGVGNLFNMAKSILDIKGNFQVIAVAGKNEILLSKLKVLEKQSGRQLTAVGFTSQIEKYMAVSDIAITKSGGLTTSECLALGLPMLVISPIPGQEERNSDYLLENGAALKANDIAGIVFRVKNILDDPRLLPELAKAAASLGRPFAARNIIAAVLDENDA